MVGASIRDNLRRLTDRIARAAERASRRPGEITLVGVSKTQPASAICEAYDAGLRHFGENRVQEWEGKYPGITQLSANWHLVGRLQSNKASRAAKLFHAIDSLDGVSLAERLDRAFAEKPSGERLRVLIEVHLGGEETKSGVSEAGLSELAERILAMGRLDLKGLMCIPPFFEDPEKVRPFFAHLRGLRDRLEVNVGRSLPVLSMGMSHDFEVAILEGATEVRVGTALFGARVVPVARESGEN